MKTGFAVQEAFNGQPWRTFCECAMAEDAEDLRDRLIASGDYEPEEIRIVWIE